MTFMEAYAELKRTVPVTWSFSLFVHAWCHAHGSESLTYAVSLHNGNEMPLHQQEIETLEDVVKLVSDHLNEREQQPSAIDDRLALEVDLCMRHRWMLDLGYENSWHSPAKLVDGSWIQEPSIVPPSVVLCRILGHQPTRTRDDKQCVTVTSCETCGYIYRTDSSD